MSTLPPTFIKDFHDEELCKRMEYRKFGLTGLQVSKVALGTGTLSDSYGLVNLRLISAFSMVFSDTLQHLSANKRCRQVNTCCRPLN